ncbi:hypothetical protein [Microbacterium enclense]|uniref:hypothetical protein n=1 Tax=Microbacterium enclense TaxID=993073 RepID=UPI003F80D350
MFAKTLFAGMVALAAAVSAIAAALFIVAPQLGPRDKLGAEIDRVAVSQGVDYFTSTGRDPFSRTTEDPAFPAMGVEVLVHAKLSGYEDRSYSVRVTALDAETYKAVDLSPVIGADGGVVSTCDDRSPKADEDGVAWRCWHVTPPRDVRYLLRVELMDNGRTDELREGPLESQQLMDFRDSETVTSIGPETLVDPTAD